MKQLTTFQPRKVGILVTVLLAAVLSSCGPDLCEGQLVSKYYEPTRTYATIEYNVALKMPMTVLRTDYESWVFMVKGFDGNDTIVERHEVVADWWHEAEVGSYVSFRDCP